jgi:hypothetical protein
MMGKLRTFPGPDHHRAGLRLYRHWHPRPPATSGPESKYLYVISDDQLDCWISDAEVCPLRMTDNA